MPLPRLLCLKIIRPVYNPAKILDIGVAKLCQCLGCNGTPSAAAAVYQYGLFLVWKLILLFCSVTHDIMSCHNAHYAANQ